MSGLRDVLIAVPTRGMISWATVTRLEEIRDANADLAPIVYQPGNLSVALTRNLIVRRFLAGPWSVLAMVDDDVVPSPHFLEMREHLDEYAMVALPHPMPNPAATSELRFTVFKDAPGGVRFDDDIEPGIHEADAVATGCVVISREAIVALGRAPFRIENDPAAALTSDDFLFCSDLKAHGFKVGYWWDGWFADHLSTVSLAPLIEAAITTKETTYVR